MLNSFLGALSASALRKTVNADPTVLLMLMNDAAFTDAKGHAVTVNGTVALNTSNTRDGIGAAQFSAASQLALPASSDWDLTSTFTIEASVYRTSDLAAGNYSRFIAIGANSTNSAFVLELASGGALKVWRPLTGSTAVTMSAASWALNSWYDLMISVKNGSASIYVNGVRQIGPTPITTQASVSSNALTVGRDTTTGVGTYMNSFPGLLDKVRITKGTALVDPTAASYVVADIFPN